MLAKCRRRLERLLLRDHGVACLVPLDIGQVELCDRHAEIVIARERERGLEILDRRDWR